ncbi:MAG: imidazole glycerol phosphate synthase subunit HisH [Ferroplasma sp. Type II]|nr:imidazole glycerol phosphate synthase subunit HisH [Ferroplasma sp. Type II]EQB74590.1 MAG: imidazole glycerol phosphate synthase subunit HisH [Ferroplasma sp. Type II]
MIAIIDINTGNLSNINRVVGGTITSNPYEIAKAEKIIFPRCRLIPVCFKYYRTYKRCANGQD